MASYGSLTANHKLSRKVLNRQKAKVMATEKMATYDAASCKRNRLRRRRRVSTLPQLNTTDLIYSGQSCKDFLCGLPWGRIKITPSKVRLLPFSIAGENIGFVDKRAAILSMFPKLDADLVTEVLQDNQCNLGRTLDELLALTDDTRAVPDVSEDDWTVVDDSCEAVQVLPEEGDLLPLKYVDALKKSY